MSFAHFADRQDAGKRLAEFLREFSGPDTIVYALPRGGVVLGYEVACVLYAPLDLIITRKIGHPMNPEYALCALTEHGELLCDEGAEVQFDPLWLSEKVEQENKEVERRRKLYLNNEKRILATDKRAIIVDDGMATGLTMRAAILSLRAEHPKEIIVAVPVAPRESIDILREEADKVIVLSENFLGAVGAHYESFPQVSDEEVRELMRKATFL